MDNKINKAIKGGVSKSERKECIISSILLIILYSDEGPSFYGVQISQLLPCFSSFKAIAFCNTFLLYCTAIIVAIRYITYLSRLAICGRCVNCFNEWRPVFSIPIRITHLLTSGSQNQYKLLTLFRSCRVNVGTLEYGYHKYRGGLGR